MTATVTARTVISVNIRLVCRCTRIVSDIVLSSGIEDGPGVMAQVVTAAAQHSSWIRVGEQCQ